MIGASIAYFLSCRGAQPIVIERAGLACAASGKSGGFLALDWCDGTPLEALARRSLMLHAGLPGQIGGEWGYRRLTTCGGLINSDARRRRPAQEAHWVSDHVTLNQRLGSPETTAQVHPGQFTAAMMRAAEAQGAELCMGQVAGVPRDHGGARVTGVQVNGEGH